MRGLLILSGWVLFWSLVIAWAVQAAPAPKPTRKAVQKEPRQITAADLQRVRLLHYGSSGLYQIGFQPDGTYWCHAGLEGGEGTLWHGTYRLVAGGATAQVILEESQSYVRADAPPVGGAGIEARLEMRRDKAGRIVGTSQGGYWGEDFRLED